MVERNPLRIASSLDPLPGPTLVVERRLSLYLPNYRTQGLGKPSSCLRARSWLSHLKDPPFYYFPLRKEDFRPQSIAYQNSEQK